MIDLTPLEVRKKKGDFRRTMRGYDPILVDDFLDLVADRLEELVRENMTLSERVGRQEQQVAEYRDRERALTEALVSAQEMREEVRRQSQREAELAKQSAEQQAAQMRADVEEESRRLRAAAEQQAAQLIAAVQHERQREEDALHHLRARQQEFLSSYRALLEHEIEELGALARTLGARSGRDYSAAARGAPREDRPAFEPTPPARPQTSAPADVPAPAPPTASTEAPVAAKDQPPAAMPASTEAPSSTKTQTPGAAPPVVLPPRIAPAVVDEYTGDALLAHDIEDEAALAMGATPADLASFETVPFEPLPFEPEPFAPEPFAPEPFLPEAEGLNALDVDADAIAEAFAAEQPLIVDGPEVSDRTEVAEGGLEARLYEGIASDESGDGVPGPIGLSQDLPAPWEEMPWAGTENDVYTESLGGETDELDDGMRDDDDDPDTTALLRNAAAAGYRLSDDDLPDELLLEETATEEENKAEDDGWLPGLLEDEK